MPRSHTRLPWRYDDQRQEFVTPSGVISLHELAALRYGLATSHIDLAGPWTGWRLRGATLRAPHGQTMAVRPDTAAMFARWLREAETRDAQALGLPVTVLRPRLRLVSVDSPNRDATGRP